MNVRGVGWLALKTNSFDAMVAFFRDVLRLAVVYRDVDFVMFALPNGDKVEIFGPTGPYPPGFFDRSPVAAGLRVQDLAESRSELAAMGIELLGPMERAHEPYLEALGPQYSWQHFRAPDGTVLELLSNPLADQTSQP